MSEEKRNLLKSLKIDQLIEHLVGYVDTKIAIVKLDIEDRIKSILAGIIQNMFILLFAFSGVLFLSLALAYFVGQVLESTFLGFTIVGLLYVLFSAIFIFDKNKKIGSNLADKIFSLNEND